MYKYWQQIDKVINKTLVLEPQKRVSFLEKTFDGEPDILEEAIDYLSFIERAETEQFLESDLMSQSFLADEISSILNQEESIRHIIGKQIGPYVIRRLIGEGGMGAVYLADRTEGGFEQKVAIKFMRGGFYSLYLRERFNSEKQILSKLNHPNIARLLDGGITEEGSPYFIMEYVDGKPVDVYCRENNLNLHERLTLFLQICRAVQYAHSKLIIHRDLKPENIYITPAGEVKVMDFGIAKLLTPDADDELAVRTREGHIIASFEFAAPEQVGAGQPSVETDVYGLGALLFLLSTEEHPFQFKNQSISEIESVIRSEPPPNPGNYSKDKIGAISKDLEAIILKTLRKEPEKRYASVLYLREEIERYQKGFPVQARKGTLRYKTVKFLKRNRSGLAVAALFSIGAISFTLYHIQQLTEERNISQVEAEKAQAVTEFMVDLFDASDPLQNVDKTVTASDLLDNGRERFHNLKAAPALKLHLLYAIASSFGKLGDFESAETIFAEGYSIATNSFKEESYEIADFNLRLGRFNNTKRDFYTAEQYLKSSLLFFNRRKAMYRNEYSLVNYSLAISYLETGRADSALIFLEESYKTDLSLGFSNNSDRILTTQNEFARIYRQFEEYDKAKKIYLTIIKEMEAQGEPKHTLYFATLNNLGLLYSRSGEYESAELYYRKSLSIHQNVYGEIHPESMLILQNLMSTTAIQKKKDETKTYSEQLIEAGKKLYGEESWQVASYYQTAGTIQFTFGNFATSSQYLEQAHSIYSRVLSSTHNWTINCRLMLSYSLFNEQKTNLALDYYNSALSLIKTNIHTYDYHARDRLEKNIKHTEANSVVDITDKVGTVKQLLVQIDS